jgi:LysM repeat protein
VKYFHSFILLFFYSSLAFGQSINWPNSHYETFPWIDSTVNSIQIGNKVLLKPFLNKLQNTSKKKVNILHIGDIHVQQNIQTQHSRSLFQNTFGNGGYGTFFPYSTARIVDIYGYKSFHFGKWIYAKPVETEPILPIGIHTLSAKTFDPSAQLKFIFNKGSIKSNYKRLHIYCKRVPQSFDLTITSKNDSSKIDVFSNGKDSWSTEIVIDLKSVESSMTIEFLQKNLDQRSFELYGFNLESIEDQGIVYHNVGSVGLGYSHLRQLPLMKNDLLSLKPDIIVLDLGTHDFFTKLYDKFELKRTIVRYIDFLKGLPFKPLIVLISPQDQFKGGISNLDYSKFSLLLMDIARTEKVAFYDWYRASGGHESMKQWISLGLAENNGFRLTETGYQLKGSMFFHAFKSTYLKINQKKDSINSLFIPILDSGYLHRIDTTTKIDSAQLIQPILPIQPELVMNKNPESKAKWIVYQIKPGETVWNIAVNFDVKAIEIKKWNNLRSYALKRGRKLNILTKYPDGKQIENTEGNLNVDDAKPNSKPKNETAKTKKYHKVKKGDTLFSISKKYDLSVNELKDINHLRKNEISIGQKLRVK